MPAKWTPAVTRERHREEVVAVIGHLDQHKRRTDLRAALSGAVTSYFLGAMAAMERDCSRDEVHPEIRAVPGFRDAEAVFAEASDAVAAVATQVVRLADLMWDQYIANQAIAAQVEAAWAQEEAGDES